jgi:hypothetical protein
MLWTINELTWIKEHCCMWWGMLEQGVRRCRTPVLHPRRTSSPCPRRGLFSSHHLISLNVMHFLKHVHFLPISLHITLAFYLRKDENWFRDIQNVPHNVFWAFHTNTYSINLLDNALCDCILILLNSLAVYGFRNNVGAHSLLYIQ